MSGPLCPCFVEYWPARAVASARTIRVEVRGVAGTPSASPEPPPCRGPRRRRQPRRRDDPRRGPRRCRDDPCRGPRRRRDPLGVETIASRAAAPRPVSPRGAWAVVGRDDHPTHAESGDDQSLRRPRAAVRRHERPQSREEDAANGVAEHDLFAGGRVGPRCLREVGSGRAVCGQVGPRPRISPKFQDVQELARSTLRTHKNASCEGTVRLSYRPEREPCSRRRRTRVAAAEPRPRGPCRRSSGCRSRLSHIPCYFERPYPVSAPPSLLTS